MKIELKKLNLKYIWDLRRGLKNPDVAKNVDYNVPTYFLKSLKEILIQRNTYKFAIITNGKFCGIVVLENPDKEKKSYEIGYFIVREYWNKGIATQAVKKMLSFGFNKLKLRRIWAGTDVKNPASGKVLKKSGFKIYKRDKCNVYWERIK